MAENFLKILLGYLQSDKPPPADLVEFKICKGNIAIRERRGVEGASRLSRSSPGLALAKIIRTTL